MDNGCDELDRLMAVLRISLPGATDAMIRLALFDAVDAHLRRTNAWRYETDITLSQGTTEYAIFPPSATTLVRVMSVTTNGRALAPMQTGDGGSGELRTSRGRLTADHTVSGGYGYFPDEQISEGDVLRYAVYYPAYIEVDIAPSAQAVQSPLQALMAITLSPECKCAADGGDGCEWALDPWMVARYHDDWLYATLSRMMSLPSKPWSNPQMAIYYGKLARSKANFAKQEADRGFVHDVQQWRFPRGGWIR